MLGNPPYRIIQGDKYRIRKLVLRNFSKTLFLLRTTGAELVSK